MNKAEWNVLSTNEKNILVAKNVMGLTVFEFEPGTNSRLFCAVPPEEIDNPEYFDEFLKRYTTDRNACALVLDEIEKLGRESVDSVLRIIGMDCAREARRVIDGWGWSFNWNLLRANPDIIWYCAVKAVENENT